MPKRSPLLATALAFGLESTPLAAMALAGLGFAGAAWAQPYRGRGTSAPEPKDKTPSVVRQRALTRARRAALELALGELGKLDKTARKAVITASDAWTGAYRVLSERAEGESVSIDVEVDIDLPRLRKKLAGTPSSSTKPLFAIGSVEAADSCGSTRVQQVVKDELTGAHAIADGGAALQIGVTCKALGPVPHTFVLAARATVEAKSDGRVVATSSVDSFGGDAEAAMLAAISEAAQSVAASAASHRRGVVALRVAGARPAARLRRFERALLQSVMGVAEVELARVDAKGNVILSVHGPSDAPSLAQALGTFSAPGVKARVLAVEGPDALSIALE